MTTFVIVFFDRYDAMKSLTTSVDAQTIQEAGVKGITLLVEDCSDSEIVHIMDTMSINEDGTKMGTDLDEESWLIFSI